MVIVDASVWIDYLRGTVSSSTDWLEEALGRESIGLTSLILCEVLQEVRAPTTFQALKQDLLEFEVFDSGDKELAIASAENYLHLRGRGITVRKTIDCLIATFCIGDGYALLHNDRDFDPFEQYLELQVLHPPESLPH
jgi:predicted nucleic acid-binding protein